MFNSFLKIISPRDNLKLKCDKNNKSKFENSNFWKQNKINEVLNFLRDIKLTFVNLNFDNKPKRNNPQLKKAKKK